MQNLNRFENAYYNELLENEIDLFDTVILDNKVNESNININAFYLKNGETVEDAYNYYECLLRDCFTLLKERGILIVFENIGIVELLIEVATNIGFSFNISKDWFTWVKVKPLVRGEGLLNNTREEVLIFRKGNYSIDNLKNMKLFNFKQVKVRDMERLERLSIPFPIESQTLYFDEPYFNSKEEDIYISSCQKPIGLMLYLLDRFTNKDCFVTDLFAESNESGIVCNMLGLKSLTFKKDKSLYDKALKRVIDFDYLKGSKWSKKNNSYLF